MLEKELEKKAQLEALERSKLSLIKSFQEVDSVLYDCLKLQKDSAKPSPRTIEAFLSAAKLRSSVPSALPAG